MGSMSVGQGEGNLGQAVAFARSGRRYWLQVYPMIGQERRRWHARAAAIPDPTLRHDAIFTLQTKWGHSEGAAAFAVLASTSYRRHAVRIAIAYQLMIDYLDTISERPVDDPFGNTVQLHRALYAAVSLDSPQGDDYYELHPYHDDGGFLAALIDACREVFALLPASDVVTESTRRFAVLYAEGQGICHAAESGWQEPADADARHTHLEAGCHPELQWGEVVAAGVSSLPVLAQLVAATSSPLLEPEAMAVGSAYYPWCSALHILLHGLADQVADQANGQFNQLNHYRSKAQAAERFTLIASRARYLVSGLPQGEMHGAILAGMGGYYLAPPQVWECENSAISRGVLDSLGPMARLALLVHRVRQDGSKAVLRPVARSIR